MSPAREAERLLWRLHPRHDAFVRHVDGRWSAEVVEPNQYAPPYRTWLIAEADTAEMLLERLKAAR